MNQKNCLWHWRCFTFLTLTLLHFGTVLADDAELQMYQEQSPWPITTASLENVEGIAIIDTGFSGGVMFDSEAIDLDSKDYSKTVAKLASGIGRGERSEWIDIPFKLDSIEFEGINAIQNDLAPVRDFLHSAQFVVGMKCLNGRALTFEKNVRNVRVHSSDVSVPNGNEFLSISRSRTNCPMIDIQLPVLGSVKVLVDTGSNEVIALTQRRVELLQRMGQAVSIAHPTKGSDVLGNVERREIQFIIRKVSLANTVFFNVPVYLSEREHIGTGLLRYFDTTLDFARNRARFSIPEGDETPIPLKASGLTCRPLGRNKIEILEVQKGCADEAGLRKSDIIHSINGEPVSEFSYWDRVVVFSQSGTTPKLTIERDGEFREVALKLRYDFPYPPEWPPEPPEFNPD